MAFAGGSVTAAPVAAGRVQVAGDPDAVGEGDLRRDDLRADLHRERAARREPAARRRVRRSGGEPGMTSSVRRSAWMFGNAASSFCVYG